MPGISYVLLLEPSTYDPIDPTLYLHFRLVVWCNDVGNIFLAHFEPIDSNTLSVNATDVLRIDADHVHPCMTTTVPSYNGYSQHDHAPCHRVAFNQFQEHNNGDVVMVKVLDYRL